MDVEIHKPNAIVWASLKLLFLFTNGNDIHIMVVICVARKAKWSVVRYLYILTVYLINKLKTNEIVETP
jgi:hypothetical protein